MHSHNIHNTANINSNIATNNETSTSTFQPQTTANMLTYQLQPQGMQTVTQKTQATIDSFKAQVQELDRINRAVAGDYRVVGGWYHETPTHLRFNKAIPARVRTDLLHNFTVSSNREVPAMIQDIEKADMIIQQTIDILAEPAGQVNLGQVRFNIMTLNCAQPHTVALMARLSEEMTKVIRDVVQPEMAAGRTSAGSDTNVIKQGKARERWMDVLPDACFPLPTGGQVDDGDDVESIDSGDDVVIITE